MSYIRLTLQFIKHNFWHTTLCAVIPAILFGIFTNPCSIFEFALKFDSRITYGFWDVYTEINEGTKTLLKFAIMCLIFIITIIFISVMIGNIQTKMRFGEVKKGSIKTYLKKVNNNILALFFCFFLVCVVTGLFGLINAAFAYFYIRLSVSIAMPMIIITYIILFGGLMFMACWGIILLPLMTIKGFGIKLAIAESSRMVARNFGKVFISVMLPLLIIFIPNMLLSAFSMQETVYKYLKIALSSLSYLVSFTYYVTLMYAIYFEVEDIEREDLKNLYQWRSEE